MLLKDIGKKLANLNYFSSHADKLSNSKEDLNNIRIGQLAYLKGYLSEENVHQILDAQKTIPKQFGELCVEKGMMTSQQMYDLLQLQLKNQCFLFNSLIPAEKNRGEMSKKLNEFKDDVLCKDQSIVDTKLYDIHFLNSIFKQTRTFLFHQGYFTHIKSLSTEFETADNQLNFACELTQDFGSSYYICLGLNERIVTSISNTRQECYSDRIDAGEYQDIFLEIMYCLNYQITQVLRKLGHSVKQGVALAHIPEYRQCVSIKLNTIIDPIEIAVVM